ncbi:NACHT domain-containing protein [Nocardiopsis synnemataformans]|uniref:NACHT domain-containing protein n=1 Tax=Nocardiopsis synnemataformans TaxID=61305 RepID=UPI003EBE4113
MSSTGGDQENVVQIHGRPPHESGRTGHTTYNSFVGDAEFVIQVGQHHGDIVHTHVAAREPSPTERAADALAEAVYRQWRDEANLWERGTPNTVAVRWRARTRGADHEENTGGTVDGRGDRLGGLVNGFRGLARRRMAVLGDAGSGKTTLAIHLTMELVLLRRDTEDRERGRTEPVPVLLSLTSWDPDREHFNGWLARRIAADYPGLPRIGRRHPARELCRAGAVLPVLDGLDEVPPERRSAVVRGLNRALHRDAQLVLTSRTREFDALSPESVLASTAVIEAQPVAAEDAHVFLRRAVPPEAVRRWAPLLAELEAHPSGKVAAALSSPLTLWLANRVYASPSSDPGELLDPARFPTRRAVEDHLLDRVVPTVFTGEVPDEDGWHPPRRWKPWNALHYLRFLARHLSRRETVELAWWRLHLADAPRVLLVPALITVALAVWAAGSLLGTLAEADSSALWGPLASLTVSNGTAFGLVCSVMINQVTRLWFGYRSEEPRRRAALTRPFAALRSAVVSSTVPRMIVVGVLTAVLTTVLAAPVAVFSLAEATTLACCLFLATALAILFTAPSAHEENVVDPDGLLASERRAVLLSVGVIAPLLGGATAMTSGLHAGAATWLASAAALTSLSPWGRWLLARASLAATLRTPPALMAFLRDARRVGILRGVGGVYQFRSTRLQERLAAAGGRSASPHRRAPRLLPESAVTPLRGGGIAVRVKRRNVNLAPLAMAVPASAVWTFQMLAREGPAAVPYVWAPSLLFLVFSGLVVVLMYVSPRTPVGVYATPGFLHLTEGGRSVRLAWEEIDEVAVRRTRKFGFDTRLHGVHVRLTPHAAAFPRRLRSDGDWYVLYEMGLDRVPPVQLDLALRRYGRGRWRPPALPEEWERYYAQLLSMPVHDLAGDGVGAAAESTAHGPRQSSEAGSVRSGDDDVSPGAASCLGVVALVLIGAATVPLLWGRVTAGDFPGAAPWAWAAALVGVLLLCAGVSFSSELTRALWLLTPSSLLLLYGSAALVLPPTPFTWSGVLMMVVSGFGLLLCSGSLAQGPDPRTGTRLFQLTATAVMVTGYAAIPSAVLSSGAAAFFSWVTVLLLVCAGGGAAYHRVTTFSGNADVPPPEPPPTWLTPLWYLALAVLLTGCAVYAALVGASVFSWVVALVTLLAVFSSLSRSAETLASVRRASLG